MERSKDLVRYDTSRANARASAYIDGHKMQFNLHNLPEILSSLITSFKRDARRRFDSQFTGLQLETPVVCEGLTNSELKEALIHQLGSSSRNVRV